MFIQEKRHLAVTSVMHAKMIAGMVCVLVQSSPPLHLHTSTMDMYGTSPMNFFLLNPVRSRFLLAANSADADQIQRIDEANQSKAKQGVLRCTAVAVGVVLYSQILLLSQNDRVTSN